MTITYGFYDSISSDRLYNALQMSSIFDGIIQDGVYAGLDNKLMVVEDTGMDVSVGSGRAWFDHTWTYNDAAISKTIANADAILNRIDVIYLEVNTDVGTRANSINVLEGTPASTPAVPDLTQTGSIHQYPLAHIYIAAAVTEIVQDDITNKVGGIDTPFVAGIIDYVTTNEILAQWEAQWETWFDSIKDQLDGEAETLLQNQINAIVGDMNPPLIELIQLKAHNHDAGDTVQIPSGSLAADAVEAGNIANDGVVAGNIATDGVVAGNIADGAVDAIAALANDIVDDTKVGNRVPALSKRQGGSPTHWDTVGTTDYTPSGVRIQVGSIRWTGSAATSGNIAITYPTGFSGAPVVIVTRMGSTTKVVFSVNPSTGTCTIYWRTTDASALTSLDILWIAIGPE
jgi:hypothetical protein